MHADPASKRLADDSTSRTRTSQEGPNASQEPWNGFAKLHQPLSFSRRADDPFGQSATKNLVLRLQVLHVTGQLGLGGAGKDHEQGVEKLRHAAITVSRLKDGR